KDISSEDATGRVDYAIKSLEDLLCITEEKPRNIKIEYAQNLAQLESAFQTNKKKRTADQAFGNDYFNYIYGIVTTGMEWHFIIYTSDGIYSTSGSEYQINLTKSAIKENPELLQNNVKRIMKSELEVLKQRITELEAENAELRKENTEIRDLRIKLSVSDAEIAELKRRNNEFLRANAEYNERRDAENAKLKAENVEFRDRLTKVEQNQTLQNALTANDNSFNNNSSNFASAPSANLVAEPTVTQHEKPSVDEEMDTLLPEEPIPEELTEVIVSTVNISVMDQCDQKSLEDKETVVFLDEEYKKKVSDEIRQRNRVKNLAITKKLRDLDLPGTSDILSSKSSTSSHPIPNNPVLSEQNAKIKAPEIDIQPLIQELLIEPLEENCVKVVNVEESDQSPAIELAHLYEKTKFDEIRTIRAKQDEIMSWYCYRKYFEKKHSEILLGILKNGVITNKKAYELVSGQIYNEMLHANKLSKLTDMQIDTIKNHLTTQREKNSRTHVTSEIITGDATAPVKSMVSVPNSLGDFKVIGPDNSPPIPPASCVSASGQVSHIPIKISKFPEDRNIIYEAVPKCPACTSIHTHRGIWGDWTCQSKDNFYYLMCPWDIHQNKKVKIATQCGPPHPQSLFFRGSINNPGQEQYFCVAIVMNFSESSERNEYGNQHDLRALDADKW
ncbi:hypothetical protein C1646_776112, partial [Rhizophagus diaphanus]